MFSHTFFVNRIPGDSQWLPSHHAGKTQQFISELSLAEDFKHFGNSGKDSKETGQVINMSWE